MKITDLVKQSPSWDVIDSSKLSTYKDCPRKYFFEYVLGWRSAVPNNHLVFGTAWHAAVEHLLLEGYEGSKVQEAKLVFLHYYRAEMPEETDELVEPKTPRNALVTLEQYAMRFKDDTTQYSFPHTEVGGVVLIGDNQPMYFKLDAIAQSRRTGKYFVLDHKTSQRKSTKWSSEWQLSSQILLYLHVLHCLYPSEEIQGARVRGTFFYKSKPSTFDEAVLEKTHSQMQSWLDSCTYWYTELVQDMCALEEEDSDGTVMRAFPHNDQSCNKYYGCPYLDFCNAWPNPLHHCEAAPLGFKCEYWDPREIPTIREELDLTKERSKEGEGI